VVKEKRALYMKWRKPGQEEDRVKYLDSKSAVWRAQEDKRQELARDLHGEEGKRNFLGQHR